MRSGELHLSDRQRIALKHHFKCMDRFGQGKTLDQQDGNDWEDE
jgi:hypothetical protein